MSSSHNNSQPFRLAILECDEPIGRTKEKYGGYGNLFRELLENGGKKLLDLDDGRGRSRKLQEEDVRLEVTMFDVVRVEVYPDLEGCDGVLLTGSRWNSFDNDPWILKLVDFTKKILAQDRVKLIGVCFGHQIIGRALGVKVGRNDRGWEISVSKMQLTPKGKELFKLDEVAIHQMHRDVVYEYPKEVEALGHSPRCDVQGMYAKNRLITVQGHPEFNEDVVAELLENRHEKGIFDDEMYEDGMARVKRHQDGVTIAAAFIRFLLDG